MIVFLSGGCKNGKSSHAERIAKALSLTAPPLYYIATMEPHDDEDLARIARHRESRAGMGFETLELKRDVEQLLLKADSKGSFLLDSLTALLANEMFLNSGEINWDAGEKLRGGLEILMDRGINLVLVSDYIYGDGQRYDELSELYRKSLALIDRYCAARADIVLEALGGQIIAHKGGDLLEAI